MLSKNVKNKTCTPKLVFFNEKNKKDSNDFWHRKLSLKVKFWHFFNPPHYTNFQSSIIKFGWFLGKNLFGFVPPAWKLDNPYCYNDRPKVFKTHTKKDCYILHSHDICIVIFCPISKHKSDTPWKIPIILGGYLYFKFSFLKNLLTFLDTFLKA